MSHPFVERLIRTIRREYLDRTLFWTAIDLESKVIGVYGSLQAPSRSRVVGWETPEQNSESEGRQALSPTHGVNIVVFHTPTAP